LRFQFGDIVSYTSWGEKRYGFVVHQDPSKVWAFYSDSIEEAKSKAKHLEGKPLAVLLKYATHTSPDRLRRVAKQRNLPDWF
jgi:hypothetical protein